MPELRGPVRTTKTLGPFQGSTAAFRVLLFVLLLRLREHASWSGQAATALRLAVDQIGRVILLPARSLHRASVLPRGADKMKPFGLHLLCSRSGRMRSRAGRAPAAGLAESV